MRYLLPIVDQSQPELPKGTVTAPPENEEFFTPNQTPVMSRTNSNEDLHEAINDELELCTMYCTTLKLLRQICQSA